MTRRKARTLRVTLRGPLDASADDVAADLDAESRRAVEQISAKPSELQLDITFMTGRDKSSSLDLSLWAKDVEPTRGGMACG